MNRLRALELLGFASLPFFFFAATAVAAAPPQRTLPAKETPAEPAPPRAGPARVSLDGGRVTRINYGYSAWNKDPRKVDSASLILREGRTGKLVQISLEETAPDSSVFSGSYSLNWQALENMAPEFFVPPQDLLASARGMAKISEMIAKGELKRRPFILRKAPRSGVQYVEIYDTKEQAHAALGAFRAEQQALELQNRKIPSDAEMDAAQLATISAEREAAAKSAAERVRISQVQGSKRAQMIAAFRALAPAEQANRRKAAKTAAEAGMAAYQAGAFPEASKQFGAAIELDPESRAYDFQYGVTLYKADDVNQAMVYLESSEGAADPFEREYFLGLCHYRQREFQSAFDRFTKAKQSKNADIRSSASFYQAVTRFDERKLDEAQPLFQEVLDVSQDAKLSERADGYIEQILRIRQFEAERAKKWTILLNVGELYDSNVTLASTSAVDQGVATNYQGYRSLVQSSVRYRPLYEADQEFAAQLDFLYMYSVDSSFAAAQALRNADPTVIGISAPWTHKGTLFGKGHKFDLVPGYETTRMSVENNEDKEILNSIILNGLNTLVMTDDWYMNANAELRKDASLLSSSTGDNDSSAIKLKLTWGNMLFLNKEKSKIFLGNLSYSNNQAQGANMTYDRYDASAMYIGQLPMSFTFVGGVSYFNLAYVTNSSGRVDNSYTATVSASRKINDLLSGSFSLSYNDNESNVDVNAYRKWTAMLTLSSNWHF